MERVKRWFTGPPLNELIADISIYTRQIGRTRDKFEQRGGSLREKAKQQILEGKTQRARMYMKQHLKAKNTSFSLDMFVISMNDLIFDLKNASNVNQIGPVMGKISKTLQKLDLLKTSGVTQIMSKVNNQMERAGFSMEQIFNGIRDYEPFSISSLTDANVEEELEKLTDEVLAEGPAMGLPPSKLDELQKKRDELRNR